MYGSMRISIGMGSRWLLAELIACATLTAIDGDTPSAMGKTCDCWGEGVPFVSGMDTPEIGSHAKCLKERKLALIAKGKAERTFG